MARQRIHNRRAGRGSSGTGASWISYSDMMAALLLIFVLILTYSLWQYFTMLGISLPAQSCINSYSLLFSSSLLPSGTGVSS